MNQKLTQSLSEIEPAATAHNQGEKFVFLSKDDTSTAITQFAYGRLAPGEYISAHAHATMEECFYFISGEGEYIIDEAVHKIVPQTFFRIPANTIHALKTTGNEPLTFVYFGVAL